jgi:hypothetical protein
MIGLVPGFAKGEHGVDAAVVELDPLPDPVRPPPRMMIFLRSVGLASSSLSYVE